MFPGFTDDFRENETGFAVACHKISSPCVATQKWGSTGKLTTGSGAAGGVGEVRGSKDCREPPPSLPLTWEAPAPQGWAASAPFPTTSCYTLRTRGTSPPGTTQVGDPRTGNPRVRGDPGVGEDQG